MHLEWMLNPLAQYLCLAAGISLCAILWLACQKDISRTRARMGAQGAAHEEALKRLETLIGELRERLKEIEEQAAGAFQPAPTGSMNLTKRTQVLRMHRRGERPEQIAAALRLTQSEVDLLLKLHLAAVKAA